MVSGKQTRSEKRPFDRKPKSESRRGTRCAGAAPGFPADLRAARRRRRRGRVWGAWRVWRGVARAGRREARPSGSPAGVGPLRRSEAGAGAAQRRRARLPGLPGCCGRPRPRPLRGSPVPRACAAAARASALPAGTTQPALPLTVSRALLPRRAPLHPCRASAAQMPGRSPAGSCAEECWALGCCFPDSAPGRLLPAPGRPHRWLRGCLCLTCTALVAPGRSL